MTASACFHCALPTDPDHEHRVEIDGVSRPVCCPGCKAVAELIRDSGMASYYAMRDAPEPGVGRPAETPPEWQVFDRDDMLQAFAELDGDSAEATLYVGDMYCAACSWLIEASLVKQRGIESAEVNPVTHRLRVRWDRTSIGLGGILGTLSNLGYDPQPLAPESTARPEVVELRTALKRLLVATLGMMQAMMFAIGLYAGDFQGIEVDMQLFLRLVSFVVTTPVVFYSARPFFAAAWRGLRRGRPGMDLPVSIAVGAAYVASVYATLTRGAAVWYDSVAMFVFFLTLGRFLEMRARHRSIDRGTALLSALPNAVTRIDAGGTTIVPVSRLVAGDHVRVPHGEAVPADGTLVEGRSSVDESLLTGESAPQRRRPGDALVAGSVNLGDSIVLRVEKTGPDTTLGAINRLSERARYARPGFVQLADRIASGFVVAIVGVAAAVAVYWHYAAPERAFMITLSVLVVTCPCALALATPAAFAAAGTRLAELRLLVTNGNAIEVLSRATLIAFDKTGTLTIGRPSITAVTVHDPTFSDAECRRVAATLESGSTHPLSAAFGRDIEMPGVAGHRVVVGEGVAGTIDDRRWRLGRAGFVAANDDAPDSAADSADPAGTRVWLGVDGRLVASFDLRDELRPDAAAAVATIRDLGAKVMLVSGDNASSVRRAADALGIREFRAGCSPGEKLALLRAAQDAGEIVVMVGDGINDAPVLAGADASVALAEGALLARTNADILLLGSHLAPLVTAIRAGRHTMRIVRQNIGWAIVYNAIGLPLAAAGFVPPWAAAIGMSASSLVVVLNALRLSRFGDS